MQQGTRQGQAAGRECGEVRWTARASGLHAARRPRGVQLNVLAGPIGSGEQGRLLPGRFYGYCRLRSLATLRNRKVCPAHPTPLPGRLAGLAQCDGRPLTDGLSWAAAGLRGCTGGKRWGSPCSPGCVVPWLRAPLPALLSPAAAPGASLVTSGERQLLAGNREVADKQDPSSFARGGHVQLWGLGGQQDR